MLSRLFIVCYTFVEGEVRFNHILQFVRDYMVEGEPGIFFSVALDAYS